ncbi:MAG: hypothetical protein J6V34_02635 [Oscillospiraceae bacterium]|nr:hypothetical protein [Oscillospiraceae bacterium]
MKLAVVFSPGAGQKQRFSAIGDKLVRLFKAHQIITCGGSFGGDYLPGATLFEADRNGGYVQVLGNITRTLLAQKPDLLISVGGDGIASYIADAMLTGGFSVPMMGVAAGTANVGPIVCISAEELEACDLSQWDHFTTSALEVISGGHVGYAVNDVVIGNTFLGTEDDQVVNLSAEAMALRGEKLVCKAEAGITTEAFTITKNGAITRHHIARPGQIIASPLDRDRLEGRAIYGALCSAAYTPCKGAMALTEQVMISAEAEDAGMTDFCTVEHLLFGPGDEVTLSGLTEHAQLILDGNPYIRTNEEVSLRYHPDLITVALPRRKG